MEKIGKGTKMNLTKKQFEEFQSHVKHYVKLFGIKDIEIRFLFEKMEDHIANCHVRQMDKVVTFRLNTVLDADTVKTWKGLKELARHEACHLLTHRLFWLGSARYISDSELTEEWESLAERLNQIIGECELR